MIRDVHIFWLITVKYSHAKDFITLCSAKKLTILYITSSTRVTMYPLYPPQKDKNLSASTKMRLSCAVYLSVPLTRHNLAQWLFIVRVLRKRVAHGPNLVPCRTILVIGSLRAM